MSGERDLLQMIKDRADEVLVSPCSEVKSSRDDMSLTRGYARLMISHGGDTLRGVVESIAHADVECYPLPTTADDDPEDLVRRALDIQRTIRWAVDILRTGRTVRCGSGVGLREIQKHNRTPDFRCLDIRLNRIPDVVCQAVGEDGCLDGWDLDPDYQRGHVWEDENRKSYLGTFLATKVSPPVWVNALSEPSHYTVRDQVIDGKQRITSILMFVNGEIEAILPDGTPIWFKDLDEQDILSLPPVKVCYVYLPTRVKQLGFYLNLNKGVAHSAEEINRIEALLEEARR